eukprot:6246789-Amphidinium_carterae.1
MPHNILVLLFRNPAQPHVVQKLYPIANTIRDLSTPEPPVPLEPQEIGAAEPQRAQSTPTNAQSKL